jgi:hypothetical protein
VKQPVKVLTAEDDAKLDLRLRRLGLAALITR